MQPVTVGARSLEMKEFAVDTERQRISDYTFNNRDVGLQILLCCISN